MILKEIKLRNTLDELSKYVTFIYRPWSMHVDICIHSLDYVVSDNPHTTYIRFHKQFHNNGNFEIIIDDGLNRVVVKLMSMNFSNPVCDTDHDIFYYPVTCITTTCEP